MSRKNIVILGSTGSIGQNTIQVIEAFPERFNVLGLAAAKNTELLLEQARKFRPKFCCLMFEESFRGYEEQFKEIGCELLWGKEGYKGLAAMNEADIVVSSMVGAAGLIPTLTAVEAGKTVALANKESLVIGGELVMSIAKRTGAQIFPVDSEHSAVFQCLNGEDRANIQNIILTASGGPFWDRSLEEMENARVEDALNHPNWSMGAKITVDSATMMNKGLEVIEARWLFDVDVDKIKVLIHRQSIVHSMVEFKDGAIMAQLGSPDMRIPIAYALSWPERLELEVKRVSFTDIARLTFEQPDFERFPLLRLGYEAAKKGGSYSVALNAANELAVDAYLARRIRFGAIQKVVSGVLEKIEHRECKSLDEIFYWDSLARLYAEDMIERAES